MSYDLEIAVKVEGYGGYATIATPEYHSPTYNLGVMFRQCTGWHFSQSVYYNCNDVINNIQHGIDELTLNPEAYRQYEPSNKWGTVESALRDLKSLKNCIFEAAEEIPIEFLYVRW